MPMTVDAARAILADLNRSTVHPGMPSAARVRIAEACLVLAIDHFASNEPARANRYLQIASAWAELAGARMRQEIDELASRREAEEVRLALEDIACDADCDLAGAVCIAKAASDR